MLPLFLLLVVPPQQSRFDGDVFVSFFRIHRNLRHQNRVVSYQPDLVNRNAPLHGPYVVHLDYLVLEHYIYYTCFFSPSSHYHSECKASLHV